MFINNKLRDLIYENNLRHGFWDNIRTYEEFAHNLKSEFEETMEELSSGHSPTEVYYKNGNKPEGVPTEVSDIIIFILDYFGGSEPKIEVDEAFLEKGDKFYKNQEYYEQVRRQKDPSQYFLEIRDECYDHISLSMLDHMLHGNESFVADNGQTVSAPLELHQVLKLVLEYCEIYGIDIEKELMDKINYNNSRPKDYRKIGTSELLETDENAVYNELLEKGYGMYKETPNVVQDRRQINEGVLKKREERRRIEDSDLGER